MEETRRNLEAAEDEMSDYGGDCEKRVWSRDNFKEDIVEMFVAKEKENLGLQAEVIGLKDKIAALEGRSWYEEEDASEDYVIDHYIL